MLRFEVYCGKKQNSQFVDTRSGPAAVVRNLKALWEQRRLDRSKKRIIITDREYSSVTLRFRLMDMGYYNIGTVSTTRLGFPEDLRMPRGSYILARNNTNRQMYSARWVDSKICYFVATGASVRLAIMRRKQKDGSQANIPCLEFVVLYNKYMGVLTVTASYVCKGTCCSVAALLPITNTENTFD
ncbi:hypothetical protein PHYSODRAFT_528066 [Phytophthora sojae]|uniref:PiggyBac transposable element-derived protein domain-containing protein n=1 Tax=Phytophthora sojae (strain P6497) TaxID=1094619 RepID=G5AA95_PHYSP|nr:hypothetical protein PHYSODRAFT_528066 [Phytophthora sojae]EGZ07524.1 hypothetical protein PHYSODRAFT_528066 [Phytophthora sojae]|eukprot:XP_009537090.1 hypothetical protein PHYSODRAFT_528066 [Phytophthora sojae]